MLVAGYGVGMYALAELGACDAGDEVVEVRVDVGLVVNGGLEVDVSDVHGRG